MTTPVTSNADVDLEARIAEAVWNIDTLRPMRSEVYVHVKAGRVTLTGRVPSIMTASEVERAALDTPGVVEVDNQLVDDGGLARRVAQVLAADPATQDIPPGYQVNCVFGRVHVIGKLDEAQQARLSDVARKVAGVRQLKITAL